MKTIKFEELPFEIQDEIESNLYIEPEDFVYYNPVTKQIRNSDVHLNIPGFVIVL